MTPKSDEKLPLVELHESEASPSQRSQTTRRQHPLQRRLPGLILVLVLFALFRAAFVVGHHYCPGKHIGPNHTYDDSPSVAGEGKLVNLEAHIMSKCPDAKDCLQMLVLPAMSRVSDKVNFTLSYIGKVDPNSDEVVCMHGAGECLGNTIQLCAAKRYPDPKQYLGFSNCMIDDYRSIPARELVEECAMEYGIDFPTLNACISDEGEGIDLLRASIERSRDAGVTKSCTVRLNNSIRCIRDGGVWSDCDGGSTVSDLVADIEREYALQR